MKRLILLKLIFIFLSLIAIPLREFAQQQSKWGHHVPISTTSSRPLRVLLVFAIFVITDLVMRV